jgi:hypothetical protein
VRLLRYKEAILHMMRLLACFASLYGRSHTLWLDNLWSWLSARSFFRIEGGGEILRKKEKGSNVFPRFWTLCNSVFEYYFWEEY